MRRFSTRKLRHKREHELGKLMSVIRSVEAAPIDQNLPPDQFCLDVMRFGSLEIKREVLADLEEQFEALIEAELKANPGTYKQLPNGKWTLVEDEERRVLRLNEASP